MEFEGRVVLITGSGRGIGRAIAAAFALEKARVIINDVSTEDELAALLRESPFNNGLTRTMRVDIGNTEAVNRMFEEIESRL